MKKFFTLFAVFMIAIVGWADDVASVIINGTATNYESLSAAFTAANIDGQTSTVKLLGDVSETTSNVGESLATLSKGTITIDLNGKKLACSGYYYGITVNGANVTIDDCSENKNGSIEAGTQFAVNYTGGNLTINAGTLKSEKTSLYIDDSNAMNKVVINGGKFVKGTGYAILVNEKPVSDMLDMDNLYFEDESGNEVTVGSSFIAVSSTVTVKSVTDENAVASVTIGSKENKYISLLSASYAAAKATAAASATVKLLKDITLSEGVAFYNIIATIDLNGKTITGSGSYVLSVYGATADVVITDNSAEKSGAVVNTNQVGVRTGSEGKLTIHAGTFTGGKGYAGLDLSNCNAVVLDGGRYTTSSESTSCSAISEDVNNSALASGYYYWDSEGNLLHKNKSLILNANNECALDITVAPLTADNAYASVTTNGTTTLYTSFADAVAAAAVDGTTAEIKILRDASAISVNFSAGTVTLDLNGKKISGSSDQVISVSGADLTITDNSTGKNGTVENTLNSCDAINFTAGKLTINAGQFTGNYGLNANDASTTASKLIVLRGGTFSAVYVPYSNVSGALSAYWDLIDMDGYYFKDAEGDAVDTQSPVVSGTVTVTPIPTEAQSLTLDESLSRQDGDAPSIISVFKYDVTMKRSMKSDRWNSVCFPFSMTDEEITSAFGSGANVMKITDITSDNVVNFEDATTIDANEFYIVKPAKDITEFTVEDKSVKNWSPMYQYGKNFNSGYYIYSAIYESTVTGMPESYGACYILSNNKFYKVSYNETNPEKGVELKGYRWCIGISTYSPGAEVKALTSNIDLSTDATSIITVNADNNGNGATYNLAGQRVNANAKGIVIKNGKKFINK